MKTNTIFIKASEVSELMGISVSYAYRIIKTLNGELEKNRTRQDKQKIFL